VPLGKRNLLGRMAMSEPIRNRIKGHRRVRAGDLVPYLPALVEVALQVRLQ
jgi:hypothetical protein